MLGCGLFGDVWVPDPPNAFGLGKSHGDVEIAADRIVVADPHSPILIAPPTPAGRLAGVVNRATTIELLPKPDVESRGLPLPGAPHGISTVIVFEKPGQLMEPVVGGGEPPPLLVPACTTLFESDPFAPLTVYVNVNGLDEAFDGIESVQLVDDVAETDLPPLTEEFAPQFVVTFTVPPDAGSDVGLTAIEQELPLVLGDEQLTVMLPAPSADAVKDELVQVSVVAWTGIGTMAKPLDATAAASTRLMMR